MSSKQERFWARVDTSGPGCWEWRGGVSSEGYGEFYRSLGEEGGRTMRAHRYAYEVCVGPIPEGLQLDHLCRNRRCVRQSHLEAVTLTENVMRGNGAAANNARKTHCRRGHPFTTDNTVYAHTSGRAYRTCRTCKQAANDRRKAA